MGEEALYEHLRTGACFVARAWSVTRSDGEVFAFTDHDLDLSFEGITYVASAGMTAQTLQQTSGLAVDNTEALGALSHGSLEEADILAGRFDGAEVRAWLVNWQDVSQRKLQFKGHLGEVRREGHGFHAELRGLTEALNQTQGRCYQKTCTAVLGDTGCAFDLTTPGYQVEVPIDRILDRAQFRFSSLPGFELGWFERGQLKVLTGAGESLVGWIKRDRLDDTDRVIELWSPLRSDLQPGDMIRLTAGCDKRAATCRAKFNNLINFQGFPFLPGEDWLMSVPSQGKLNNGGSLGGR